ncbi:Voltage-gated potassium channel Kch [Kordia antarctica]|uniref:Voltage-gated potassium channel Kch n=1 Tax=Kordia antarctica TaxID=1218801 RepID=A0A7L4ZPS0_9FLAO|nr:potassium channel protein [Kordia antarctica]QHI38743.1 Voltage-gated potassium channel Kch [Kordia antarctica]
MYRFFKSKFYLALSLLVIVFTIGVMGFHIISDMSWIDAIYMTTITITTVGFGEVVPLDQNARLFTVCLIIVSVFVLAYAISVITEYIISRSTLRNIIHRKTLKKIRSMENHIIICGFGRNGRQASEKLRAHDQEFIIIEKDRDVIERYEDVETYFIEGNASDDEILLKAGIEKASSLITALPSDADNLFVVLSARQINKELLIISRASQETSYKKLKLAGADNVIMPDRIGGEHMASLVVVPDLIEFIDKLSISGKNTTNIEEINIESLTSFDREISLKELDLRKETGCTVIGYKTPEGDYIINPEAELKLSPASKIIVLGRPEQVESLKRKYNL